MDREAIEYVKYGDEWRNEVMENKKSVIVDMLRRVAMERDSLAALRDRLAELVCPECDSRVMDNGYCMMGHWCGKPLK
jgi:hypothetical protein